MSAKKTASAKAAPRRPVQARGIQTREKILQAGEALLLRHGFHNILADDIARAAGVSVGSFYAYFEDKRALFLAVLQRASTAMVAGSAEQLAGWLTQSDIEAESLLRKTIRLLIEGHRIYLPLYQEAREMSPERHFRHRAATKQASACRNARATPYPMIAIKL